VIKAIAARASIFPVFFLLQCLDGLTTLIFLTKGIAEGNPLISWSMAVMHVPWAGLVAAKIMAALIGLYCSRTGRIAFLRRASVGYSAIVAWNLFALLAGAAAH
jgi:hypothetical protein